MGRLVISALFDIIKQALRSWIANDPITHSAAAAYFAVFSLPGLMIIIVSIATFFLDESIVRSEIQAYVGGFIGKEAALSIQSIIDNARINNSGVMTLILGGAVVLFGATGFFVQLKNSFNAIWHVRPKPEKTLLRWLVNRGVSLSIAIMFGVLVLLSIYVSAGLKIVDHWIMGQFSGVDTLRILDLGLSYITVSVLFTIIFKILPDVRIRMRYALAGGFFSSFLFMIGEWGFAQVLSIASPQSVFGAAGSVVLVMIWVTYGCMILQLGAEFIKALVQHYEEEIKTTRFVIRK
ncbi:MAG: YihY/virulence factor BrkB family protein [Alphaproteobacteria bacterium]